jgi:hypothetical protein
MKRLVHVTQDHIDQGDPEKPDSCAVALALRELPEVSYARVGAVFLHVRPKSAPIEELVPSPRSVRRFIKRFDDGKPTEPFCFILKTEYLP